ncbi:hybrid sensor histidine kinase/response regulator transcription factor [Flammeovirga aprica]|uniref:histidine kinase n=1 Tax=Flammeovirga aprica JL-4 TaxID=694437 RepID=A0A7X9RXJ6_9BACT|nr:two-component regulator propeller domain-containing protein [Flammeovirga aprica]NME70434.1 response regulator [Flammeovirga aprica JL-4]
MKLLTLLFLITICLFFDVKADHQLDSYQFQYFNVSNGLPTNYAYKIRQDSSKRLWLATNSGLVIFDSKNFEVKRPSQRYSGLKNENISALYLQSDSIAWIGTQSGGLSSYNISLDQFTYYDDITLKDSDKKINRITSIAEDNEGNLWLSTFNHGVVVYKVGEGIIKRFNEKAKVAHVIKDKFGNMWFSSFNTLYKYDPSEERLIVQKYLFGEMMELYYDAPRDQLILGTAKGLYKTKTSVLNIEPFDMGELAGKVRGINTVKVDKEGCIWIGSWTKGLYVSNKDQNSFKKLPLIKDFKTNSQYEGVLDIFFDADDNIWVGTSNGGLVKLINEHSLKNYHNSITNDIGLEDNNILSVSVDQYKTLWCGTWMGGLFYLSPNSSKFHLIPESKGQRIREIIYWKNYMIFGGTRGVYVMDRTNNQMKIVGHYLNKIRANSFYIDKEGMFYLGTQMNGLIVVDLKNDITFSNPLRFTIRDSELINNRITTIGEDDKGRIWLGTFNGLQLFDKEKKTFEKVEAFSTEKRSSLIVLSLNFQQKGKLWCSTSQGLIKADITDKFRIERIFTVEDGLNNDYINGISFDKNNRLWFSNTIGIGTISPNEKNILNIDREKKVNNVMNNDAIFNDGEKIYFGGTNGIYILSPDKINLQAERIPNIVVTDFFIHRKKIYPRDEINGRVILKEQINYLDELELKYDENTISLKMISPNHHANSHLYYQFRIKELEKDWIDNGKNELINLIDLKPGQYHLQLRSTFDYKSYSEIKHLTLIVHPPLWLTWWAKLIYLTLFLVIAYFVIRFLILKASLENDLKIEKIKNEQEHELNESKLMFFTNISHELRTPLTLIISPLSEMVKMDLPKPIQSKITNIYNNANRLLDLINNLLDFRKAENGMLRLNTNPYRFDEFIEKIFNNFKSMSDDKNINFELIKKKSEVKLNFDHDKMEMVVCNLLSNAFKFTTLNGTVQVIVDNDDNFATLHVKDTGKGISSSEQEKIFNRYYQIKDTETINMVGTGIGLALTKKIVELHNGKIEITSEKGKGTEFIVSIPHTVVDRDKEQEEVIEEVIVEEEKPKEKQKVLIVDDNEEIRSYLKTIFEERYHIILASNGEEAKEKALQVIPDLILSDVMMPKMNGIELCQLLKDNISTAHIPILLLTAKTDNKHEIEGLQSGADDYIRKPFDVNVLNTKVDTHLQNRIKVQRHFQNKIRFEPNASLNTENKDEKFLQDLSEFINLNLENDEFHVETLAEHFCMSQSTLYRKLKGLTGMTIAGFIRSIRLKRASELLLQEDLKLYVVGGLVGINDYKYFKKEFTKQFGVSPKDFREKKKKEMMEDA